MARHLKSKKRHSKKHQSGPSWPPAPGKLFPDYWCFWLKTCYFPAKHSRQSLIHTECIDQGTKQLRIFNVPLHPQEKQSHMASCNPHVWPNLAHQGAFAHQQIAGHPLPSTNEAGLSSGWQFEHQEKPQISSLGMPSHCHLHLDSPKTKTQTTICQQTHRWTMTEQNST